jgi:hypothetical protein
MGEQAILAVLGLFAVMGVAGWLLKARRDTPFITLREFWMSRIPERNCYLRLAGRPAGFGSWLRSLFGIHAEVRFEASSRAVRRTYHALSTWSMDAVPLEGMGACHCGYRKNPIFLVLFFAFLLGAFTLFGGAAGQQRDRGPLAALGVLSLLVAIVEMIAYWLSKRMEIAVETGGGRLIGVAFKPSLIENATFSRDELEEVMRILVAISGSAGRAA